MSLNIDVEYRDQAEVLRLSLTASSSSPRAGSGILPKKTLKRRYWLSEGYDDERRSLRGREQEKGTASGKERMKEWVYAT